jgi:hypothetical protein
MSLTGLQRQEELIHDEEYNSNKNFPLCCEIMWEEFYPMEIQTWAHRLSFRKNILISHWGRMIKEAYEGVETIARERGVPVSTIWHGLALYKPTNGFIFDSDIESPYRKLDPYATLSDSGSAYAGTMRTIQWIAQNGVDSKYIKVAENNGLSALFADDDTFRISIISVSLLAFFGKIAYDEYSK